MVSQILMCVRQFLKIVRYIYMRDMDELIYTCTQLYIHMCMHYVKKIRLVALISPWQIMHREKACEQ